MNLNLPTANLDLSEDRLRVSAPNPGFARPPEGVRENLGAALRFLVRATGRRCDRRKGAR